MSASTLERLNYDACWMSAGSSTLCPCPLPHRSGSITTYHSLCCSASNSSNVRFHIGAAQLRRKNYPKLTLWYWVCPLPSWLYYHRHCRTGGVPPRRIRSGRRCRSQQSCPARATARTVGSSLAVTACDVGLLRSLRDIGRYRLIHPDGHNYAEDGDFFCTDCWEQPNRLDLLRLNIRSDV